MHISFDGIDGAGKTTLIQGLLTGPWKDENTLLVKLPKAFNLDDAFSNELELSWEVSRAMEVNSDLLVVQDRSMLTTMTYSIIENEATEAVLREHLRVLGTCVPSFIFYLDILPEKAWERKQDMYDLEFLKKVYNTYELSIKMAQGVTKVIRIDATKPTQEQIREVVNAVY